MSFNLRHALVGDELRAAFSQVVAQSPDQPFNLGLGFRRVGRHELAHFLLNQSHVGVSGEIGLLQRFRGNIFAEFSPANNQLFVATPEQLQTIKSNCGILRGGGGRVSTGSMFDDFAVLGGIIGFFCNAEGCTDFTATNGTSVIQVHRK